MTRRWILTALLVTLVGPRLADATPIHVSEGSPATGVAQADTGSTRYLAYMFGWKLAGAAYGNGLGDATGALQDYSFAQDAGATFGVVMPPLPFVTGDIVADLGAAMDYVSSVMSLYGPAIAAYGADHSALADFPTRLYGLVTIYGPEIAQTDRDAYASDLQTLWTQAGLPAELGQPVFDSIRMGIDRDTFITLGLGLFDTVEATLAAAAGLGQ